MSTLFGPFASQTAEGRPQKSLVSTLKKISKWDIKRDNLRKYRCSEILEGMFIFKMFIKKSGIKNK